MLEETLEKKKNLNVQEAAVKEEAAKNCRMVEEKQKAVDQQQDVLKQLKYEEAALMVDSDVSHSLERKTIEV